ncbi:MAG: hypothetical protein K6A77_13020 [Clostridiales bacterium]|nr:hypothetical protein [Clostridiales bacterium]
MIHNILRYGRYLLALLPFIFFVYRNWKANLKKPIRSQQFLMPLLAFIYCLLIFCFLNKINDLLTSFIYAIPRFLERLSVWVAGLFDGKIEAVAKVISRLADFVTRMLARFKIVFILFFAENTLFLLAHIWIKRIVLQFLKRLCKPGQVLHDKVAGLFYEEDKDTHNWYIKKHFGQARTLLKTSYFGITAITIVAGLASFALYRAGWLETLFLPVFGIIIIGELYFLLDGLTRDEMKEEFEGIDAEAAGGLDLRPLRDVLRRLFGDKLISEDTTVASDMRRVRSNEELLAEFEESDDRVLETYGRFMRQKTQKGLELDQNYLKSGEDLLRGKSVLFNNPFYYDLIPYIFYPMNHLLLQHKKILIILGRHDTEEDAKVWCSQGLQEVTNIPDLWNIGVLKEETQEDLHIGIVTRSSVHDLKLHEANRDFFSEVAFVILMEPSRLVTTAQVGLNSIVRHCRMRASGMDDQPIIYCSMDKNCDGLVDALSHILMTSLTEVAATNRHEGVSSYMCWSPDEEFLQHRMLPHISRYLGVGTELAFAGLKNQVPRADWYGGEAFPVVDMHWISKQYYYDLLHYANKPTVQEGIDTYFHTTPNLWNAKKEDDHYMIVEDEAFNMFEVRRDFATRAGEQGFVNVISSDYLLKDYMAENNGIFNTDPKAIPYIVADYAHTERNVILRLCLRMSVDAVPEEEFLRELMLVGLDTVRPEESLWHWVCNYYHGDEIETDFEGRELLVLKVHGRERRLTCETIQRKRKYSFRTGKRENTFSITDPNFIEVMLGDLHNAGYIAEDEKGEEQYLGAELKGHIFQKYLPGQFFTLGGKYYEMLRLTSDGRVLVRRAADHINGRPLYRQVRKYHLSNIKDSELMGDNVSISGLKIARQYADISVDTPAYWEMVRYNDFEKGNLVTINGVPERAYRSKQVLRVELPGDATPEIYNTLVLMLNEVFRSLFAENQDYIAAVLPGEVEKPLTYSLDGVEGNCFYIIEDSQMDIGLLEAVRRNLKRIFGIVTDYLDWNAEMVEKSMNPPPEPEPDDTPFEFPQPEEGEAPPKKGIKGIISKIAGFFKRIWNAIKKFFSKIFKRKKKGAPEEGTEVPAEVPEEGAEAPVEVPEEGTEAPVEGVEAEAVPAEETPAEEIPAEEVPAEEVPAEETPAEETPAEEIPTEEVPEAEAPDNESSMSMFSAAPGLEDIPDEAVDDVPVPEAPTEKAVIDGDLVEFEPEQVQKPGEERVIKPYHERYYLLYGGTSVPSQLDPAGTLNYLKQLGFDKNELKQARDGKNIADMIGATFVPNKEGVRYCDFCGAELVGNEYERLADGRERCLACGATALKTAAEFNALYKEVVRNLEIFYGVKNAVAVHVQMVNAKKLHKKLKKSFVPTGNSDGRVLGVAIRTGNNYEILLENGAPRLQSAMTMAHEMTHIWQYLNWDRKKVVEQYGKEHELEIYEGMAKWAEIQYAYLIGEPAAAKMEELITQARDDEYGRGFLMYQKKYPLSTGISLSGKKTPFTAKESKPL